MGKPIYEFEKPNPIAKNWSNQLYLKVFGKWPEDWIERNRRVMYKVYKKWEGK